MRLKGEAESCTNCTDSWKSFRHTDMSITHTSIRSFDGVAESSNSFLPFGVRLR